MNSIIIARGVSLTLPNGRELFPHPVEVSLDARLTALVGPNGVGKTMLANLLAGEWEPTQGTIQRKGLVAFFPQRKEPDPITVHVFLGSAYTWSVPSEKLLTGINRNTLCTTLSGGQWMRVRLASTLDHQFLILDEPTNDLDRAGRDAFLQFLRNYGGGALLISHDRECLERCEEVLELSNRGLTRFGGGWAAYTEHKEKECRRLQKVLEQAKRDRDAAISHRKEQQARQEKRNRRGAKAAARGGQAKILLGGRKSSAQVATGKHDLATLERTNRAVLDTQEAFRELKIEPVMYADLMGCEIPSQKLVAEAYGFNIRFDRWIYQDDLSFGWRGGVRIAVKGDNGSGKSTLLQAILGTAFKTRGEFRRGDLVTLYLDQRCALLDPNKSILENVRTSAMLSEHEIRNGLAYFLFTKESVFQKVQELSGGERVRAALACGFLSKKKPELLLLDEPTNNLDLANVEFLEQCLRAFRGALVVVSHDEIFLKNCGITQTLLVTGVSSGSDE